MHPDSYKQYISSLAILFVSLFVGLPIWWKTTKVYRSPLPYEEIRHLAEDQAPRTITLRVSLLVIGEKDDTTASAIRSQLVQKLRAKQIIHGGLQLEIHFATDILGLSSGNRSLFQQAKYSNSTKDFLQLANSVLPSSHGHYIILVDHRDLEEPTGYVGCHRVALVEGKKDDPSTVAMVKNVIESVYGDTEHLQRILSNTEQLHMRVDADSMRQMKASQGYQISFTLINPNPAELEARWDIEEVTEDILVPFLQMPGISSLGNFTISSQVFYYTDVKFQASSRIIPADQNSDETKLFQVLTTQLPVMISSVESKLGSQVSQLPSIYFLVYLPRKAEHPLYIVEPGNTKNRQEGFLVPQWGGVVIYNELPENSSSGTRPSLSVKMGRVMPVFIEQLIALFGVPSKTPTIKGIQFFPSNKRVTDWQLDLLLTAKLMEGVITANRTLVSLVELLDKVKNMVISDHIRDEVVSSVEDMQQCFSNLKEGNINAAYWNARSAMQSSEAAFFDRSILALLYFPDDQKYAIYIPLFLPISIPILLSSLTAFKWIARSLKSEKTKTD